MLEWWCQSQIYLNCRGNTGFGIFKITPWQSAHETRGPPGVLFLSGRADSKVSVVCTASKYTLQPIPPLLYWAASLQQLEAQTASKWREKLGYPPLQFHHCWLSGDICRLMREWELKALGKPNVWGHQLDFWSGVSRARESPGDFVQMQIPIQ